MGCALFSAGAAWKLAYGASAFLLDNLRTGKQSPAGYVGCIATAKTLVAEQELGNKLVAWAVLPRLAE